MRERRPHIVVETSIVVRTYLVRDAVDLADASNVVRISRGEFMTHKRDCCKTMVKRLYTVKREPTWSGGTTAEEETR